MGIMPVVCLMGYTFRALYNHNVCVYAHGGQFRKKMCHNLTRICSSITHLKATTHSTRASFAALMVKLCPQERGLPSKVSKHGVYRTTRIACLKPQSPPSTQCPLHSWFTITSRAYPTTSHLQAIYNYNCVAPTKIALLLLIGQRLVGEQQGTSFPSNGAKKIFEEGTSYCGVSILDQVTQLSNGHCCLVGTRCWQWKVSKHRWIWSPWKRVGVCYHARCDGEFIVGVVREVQPQDVAVGVPSDHCMWANSGQNGATNLHWTTMICSKSLFVAKQGLKICYEEGRGCFGFKAHYCSRLVHNQFSYFSRDSPFIVRCEASLVLQLIARTGMGVCCVLFHWGRWSGNCSPCIST